MARISYLTREAVSPELSSIFREGQPQHVPGLLAHAPANAAALVNYLISILSKQKLDPKVRELCILYNARLMSCDYEWVQHESIGVAAGLTKEDIEVIKNEAHPESAFSGQSAAALLLTRELVETGTAKPETITAILQEMSEQELVELIMAVTAYLGLAVMMNALAIDTESGMGSEAAHQLIGD